MFIIIPLFSLICSTYTPPNCKGGYYRDSFKYLQTVGGVTREDMYPFNVSAPTCDETKTDFAVSLTKVNQVVGEQAMIDHVLGGGTLAVRLAAIDWQHYVSGVYSNCGPSPYINHAVQIVGVNVPGGYWIVRNSWGASFGYDGNMRLALVCPIEICSAI